MGAFNTVSLSYINEKKKEETPIRVQFKYGDVWQYNYTIGEELKWGLNEEGDKTAKKVLVAGYLEGDETEGIPEEYDIYIENNKIVSVVPSLNYSKYFSANRDYIILD